MDLRQLKKQLDKDIKEICRQLNGQPIDSFVRAFEHQAIFKRYEECYGDGLADLAQKILQNLKDDTRPRVTNKNGKRRRPRRFILSISGLWQGLSRRIWVIASSAQTADIRRFQAEKLKDMQEQADLFDEWQEEIEQRTGLIQTRIGAQLNQILNEARKSLGFNGSNGSALPPSP
jgi:hypothetical protein